MTVNGTTFTDNSATDGGAIYDTAGLVLTSGMFTDNSATNFGGALDIAGPMTISGGTFSANSAYAGGAVYTASSSTITNASLTGNTASIGGAVANASTGTLTVSNQSFIGNSADDGGAIANLGTLTVSGATSTFTGNSANLLGGGLYNGPLGTATISGSTFSANSGNVGGGTSGFVGGGGIGNDGGTLTLSYLTFSANTAAGGYGGGIASEAVQGKGSVSLSYTTLSGDSAAYGGAISNYAAMTVTNTTMSSEVASYGGAVQNAGSLTMTNATLADNTAATAGGGAYNNGGTLTAVNVTIAENLVAINGAGGGLDVAGGVAVLYNTIVAANAMQGTPATASDIFTSGTGTTSASSAYNLIGIGGSGSIEDGSKGNIVLTSLTGIGLAPLGVNGGQNPTVALQAGSPAIDAGSATIPGVTVPTVDQRGAAARPGRRQCRPETRHRGLRGELVVLGHGQRRHDQRRHAASGHRLERRQLQCQPGQPRDPRAQHGGLQYRFRRRVRQPSNDLSDRGHAGAFEPDDRHRNRRAGSEPGRHQRQQRRRGRDGDCGHDRDAFGHHDHGGLGDQWRRRQQPGREPDSHERRRHSQHVEQQRRRN